MDNKSLLLDLVEWIGDSPKPYDEVMTAWRTSCPRLQIWEDAVDRGFVVRSRDAALGETVEVTEDGQAFLRESGRRGT